MARCVNCGKELVGDDGYAILTISDKKICGDCKEKLYDANVSKMSSMAEFEQNVSHLKSLGATDEGITYLRACCAQNVFDRAKWKTRNNERNTETPIESQHTVYTEDRERKETPQIHPQPVSAVCDSRSFWLKLYSVCTWIAFIVMLIASIVYAIEFENFLVALIGVILSFITVSLNMLIIETADHARESENNTKQILAIVRNKY